ncbi:hypothetical protein GCM10020295_08390 [Streptomyces cinereospinus]
MFHTGRPMGTAGCPSSPYGWYVTSTAASVGPYRLCSGTPVSSRQRRAAAVGSASPLLNTWRREAAQAGSPITSSDRRNAASMDGTKCIVVMPCSRTSAAR